MKKLTAVTISANGKKIQTFLWLEQLYDMRGRKSSAYLPGPILDAILADLGVWPGQAYSKE